MSALRVHPDIRTCHEARVESACSTPGESELVESARRDPAALSQLYRGHYPVIFGYVSRRVGNRALAEDLVSDVFVAMVRYLPKYRYRNVPFRAWLYRLATNRVNRWARWQRRRAGKELRETPCPRRDREASEMAGYVRTALLTLPVPFQAAVALHYLEGLSLEEIARVVDCPVGTVKSRLARGRELLRIHLNESDGER